MIYEFSFALNVGLFFDESCFVLGPAILVVSPVQWINYLNEKQITSVMQQGLARSLQQSPVIVLVYIQEKESFTILKGRAMQSFLTIEFFVIFNYTRVNHFRGLLFAPTFLELEKLDLIDYSHNLTFGFSKYFL